MPPAQSVCPNDHSGLNYVPMPSRDQGACQLCWLYATVHSLEIQYALQLGRDVHHVDGPLVLSIQHLVDCLDLNCPLIRYDPIVGCAEQQGLSAVQQATVYWEFLATTGLVEEHLVPTTNPIDGPQSDFYGTCDACTGFGGLTTYYPFDGASIQAVGRDVPAEYDLAKQEIIAALYSEGPVSTSISIDAFGNCDPSQTEVQHRVLIIGYREDGDWMIVKDS